MPLRSAIERRCLQCGRVWYGPFGTTVPLACNGCGAAYGYVVRRSAVVLGQVDSAGDAHAVEAIA